MRDQIKLIDRLYGDLPGIRPPLISDACFSLLDELRGFRYFFRHAYSYEIDFNKLQIVIEAADKLRDLYRTDIEYFINLFTSRDA